MLPHSLPAAAMSVFDEHRGRAGARILKPCNFAH